MLIQPNSRSPLSFSLSFFLHLRKNEMNTTSEDDDVVRFVLTDMIGPSVLTNDATFVYNIFHTVFELHARCRA